MDNATKVRLGSFELDYDFVMNNHEIVANIFAKLGVVPITAQNCNQFNTIRYTAVCGSLPFISWGDEVPKYELTTIWDKGSLIRAEFKAIDPIVGDWGSMAIAPKDQRILLRLNAPEYNVVIAQFYLPWEIWVEVEPDDPECERYGIGTLVPTGWMYVPK